MLALVTFVNRAGSMVIPFLSLYLTADMGLSLPQVGWVMSCFGAGSVLGSWLGGRLTDRIGFYDVLIGSLFATGLGFILLQFVVGFLPFCVAVFLLTVLMDSFRPAVFVALRAYAKPENRTRAVTLVRLAINLGFSFGPAIGGSIIATSGYSGLFWVDGLTCFVAVGIMWYGLPRTQARMDHDAARSVATRSPYRDGPFLVFLLAMVLISIPFLQYFSTMPLFYREVHGLSEFGIGVLLSLNGSLIFLLEMPLIKFCEDRKFGLYRILVFSVVLFALSFLVLNFFPVIAFLWVGMVLMTVGEMLNFPFMNRFAYDRSDRGQPGAYMALFTISWSVAHIIGHTLGLNLVAWFGFEVTWYVFATVMVLAMGALLLVQRMMAREASALK
ncbi:MAG: MFS transporter [Flavobacteriales bacterium]|nr:MFS transporter [Flavobacteriales bacterium]MBK6882434.1 MFS transporter [Flavobacteriales bacterium]MBK7101352.1 MFS transporter [Flavobacteriales bacterium]MBK7112060.1 MFS transporter [Flavobacteriales bacterium]MBK7481943.1 MFS transporter [Flavobacteriales bacterium]